MSLDFRAGQIRNNKMIASGSTGTGAKYLIYGVGAASDTAGTINPSVFGTGSIGTDVFLFVSGGIGQRGVGGTNSTTVFGGDVVVSGVLSASNINALSAALNSVYVRRDGSSPMTANWNIGETTFLAAAAYGTIYGAGVKKFFVSHSSAGQLRVFEQDSSNNWVFGETNGSYVTRTAVIGPNVEISAGALGNYHLYVYSTGGITVGLETDPGAGNVGFGNGKGLYAYNNSSQYFLLAGSVASTHDAQYGDSKATGLSFNVSSALGFNEIAKFRLHSPSYFSGGIHFTSGVVITGSSNANLTVGTTVPLNAASIGLANNQRFYFLNLAGTWVDQLYFSNLDTYYVGNISYVSYFQGNTIYINATNSINNVVGGIYSTQAILSASSITPSKSYMTFTVGSGSLQTGQSIADGVIKSPNALAGTQANTHCTALHLQGGFGTGTSTGSLPVTNIGAVIFEGPVAYGATSTARQTPGEYGRFTFDLDTSIRTFILGQGEGSTSTANASSGLLRAPKIVSGTNQTGRDLLLAAGLGTGNGTSGLVGIYVPVTQSSGEAQHQLTLGASFTNSSVVMYKNTTVSGALMVSGAQSVVTRIISGSDTVNSTDYAIFVHSGSTVTLPGANVNPGRVLIMYCALGKQFISGAGLTLTPSGSDAINDNVGGTVVTASYGRAFSLISLGSENRWYCPEI